MFPLIIDGKTYNNLDEIVKALMSSTIRLSQLPRVQARSNSTKKKPLEENKPIVPKTFPLPLTIEELQAAHGADVHVFATLVHRGDDVAWWFSGAKWPYVEVPAETLFMEVHEQKKIVRAALDKQRPIWAAEKARKALELAENLRALHSR